MKNLTEKYVDVNLNMCYTINLGGLSDTALPDPIPNSVVKRVSGDDNAFARVCENTSLPGFLKISKKVR